MCVDLSPSVVWLLNNNKPKRFSLKLNINGKETLKKQRDTNIKKEKVMNVR